jgi:hypothetical protein
VKPHKVRLRQFQQPTTLESAERHHLIDDADQFLSIRQRAQILLRPHPTEDMKRATDCL